MEEWKKTALELWKRKKSWNEIHQQVNKDHNLNLSWDKVRDYLRKTKEYKKNQEKTSQKNYKETVEKLKDGTIKHEKDLWLTSEQANDENYILKAHGYNPAKFELINFRHSSWDAQTKGGGKTKLYSSKITVKPTSKIDPKELLKDFIKEAAKYSPVKPRKIKQSVTNALIINVTDLHGGQLSWGEESGKNYDYKIVKKNLEHIVNDVITKSPYTEYEKIYFIIGNDLFNSDNYQGSTTKGTPQTNDIRPQKMFNKIKHMMLWCIDVLRAAFPTSPIETLLVPGNHDKLTSYYLAEVMNAWFRNDNTVKVDISPKLHKGIAYGDTALLFTHGEKELKNLDWVYTEFRHLIGQTKVTEIHAGHIHRIKVEEKNGAIIKHNPAAAYLNSWSYGEGYGAISQAISRVYSRQGLEHEFYSRV